MTLDDYNRYSGDDSPVSGEPPMELGIVEIGEPSIFFSILVNFPTTFNLLFYASSANLILFN